MAFNTSTVGPAQLLPITGQINVKAHGAKGDGSSDDTASIQNAINAAAAAGGGTVILGPGTFIHTGLVLKNRVWLEGSSMRGTVLFLKNGSNVSSIKNYVSSNGIEANAEFCAVLNLKIDGNKANQTGTSHGIEFNTNPGPGPAPATNDDDFDSHQLVRNVLIQNVRNDGFYGDGRSVHYLENVEAYYCAGNGFTPSFDSTLVGCVAGQCGLAGFRIIKPNVRLVGCNSFYSGQTTAGSGNGFYISGKQGPTSLSGCIAQDNKANGFSLDSAARVSLTGCLADSNSTSGVGSYAGYSLWDSTYNILEGCISQERMVANGTSYQRYALQVRSNSINNRLSVQHSASDGGNGFATIGVPIFIAGSDSLPGNDFRINNQGGIQSPAFAATFSPKPYDGSVINVTLTGNITALNVPATGEAHPGMEMTFVFTQDATGGRTVSFNAGYKTSWTPVTTAAKKNIISLVYDGTSWVQKYSSVGI